MTAKILEKFKEYQISISDFQAKQLEEFMLLVLEKNKEINLTSITDKDEFVVKHLLDSALALSLFEDNSLILDIGSGAGFPGIVLKILNPTLKITLLDSVKKKTDFLVEVKEKLALKNLEIVHSRVEDFIKDKREKFDFVTSRAVASMSTLLEYSLPFLKINGKMIVYKGPNVQEELKNVINSFKILAGRLENIIQLNIEENTRNILIINKEKIGSKFYPRSKNLPRKNPLN